MTKREIGNILLNSRTNAGKTREEVADLLGKSVKTIGHWETGYASPDTNSLFYLCSLYGVDLNETFGFAKRTISTNSTKLSNEALRIANVYENLTPHGKGVVQAVINYEQSCMENPLEEPNVIPFRQSLQPASAGTGVYLGPEEFETIFVHENAITRRASFGVPVIGDSMMPLYHDGNVLIVESVDELKIGEIGVFTVGGEGYVKELGDGVLISLNPQYDDIPLTEDSRCNGRVIGILRPEWVVDK